jgi:hypothetical protein
MWRAILLTAGAYVLTLIVASLAAVILLSVLAPRGCNAMSQALLVLWVTIAVLFLASGIAVSVAAWKRLSHSRVNDACDSVRACAADKLPRACLRADGSFQLLSRR